MIPKPVLMALYFFQNPVHPTTGILAVIVALNYCDVVHIAGFGYPNSKRERHPIHYFGHDTMKSMKVISVWSDPPACCKIKVLTDSLFSAAEFLPWSWSWSWSLEKTPRLRSHFIPALIFMMPPHRDLCAFFPLGHHIFISHMAFLWFYLFISYRNNSLITGTPLESGFNSRLTTLEYSHAVK